jgi:hypothetical protein
MARKFQTLEHWIDEALSDSDKVDTTTGAVRACSAFTLLYQNANGIGTKEIHTIPLRGKTGDAKNIATKLRNKAEGFAQDLGGSQSFLVQAFYGDAKEPEATRPIRCVDGELVTGEDWRQAEAPTEKGVLAQMMRHLEHKDQIIMSFFQGSVGQWATERRGLQNELNDAYAIVREIMMADMKNKHEMQMAQLAFARTTEERRVLMGMIPAITNGLTGKEIFPQGTSDSAIVDALARNLRPEQLEMAAQAGIIPPALLPAITARFAQTRERDQAERQELARVPDANSDPVKDAQGL